MNHITAARADRENEKRIADEKRIIRRLVRDALAAGLVVSVYDGEEFAVKRSTNERAIMDALMSTDSDTLYFRDAAGTKLGVVALIYGNHWDVISDYSDNPAIEALLAGANEVANAIERK